MKARFYIALASLAVFAVPSFAQDDGGGAEIIVTGTRIQNGYANVAMQVASPPVIGLKRQADSAVRNVEIVSDSRESDMRSNEVRSMLLAAIDKAQRDGVVLVTGQFEVTEVTRANWQDHFPGLSGKDNANDDEDDDGDDYDDDDNQPKLTFQDDGSTTTIRLKVKTKLTGSISDAQQKISKFVKSVPATGRSLMEQKGGMALTIIKPEQYRDEIYGRIATGAKHAVSFYGPEYSIDVSGLDKDIAWEQVSNTEVFLYLPYSFTVGK